MKKTALLMLIILCYSYYLKAQGWVPDLGNGGYKNPIIFADYSDPDIIRGG